MQNRKGQHKNTGPSLTRQDVGIETDINKIMARGLNPQGRLSTGMQGTRVPGYGIMPSSSFHEMLNQVIDAQHSFRALPARIRARFQNSPEQMLRFCEDEKNRPEAIRLGLVPDDPENPILNKTPQQVDLERVSRSLDSATSEQLQAALDKLKKT